MTERTARKCPKCEELCALGQSYCTEHRREYERAWKKTEKGKQKNRSDIIKHLYGISYEEYLERLNRPCAICGRRLPPRKYKDTERSAMHLDHCHSSKQLRDTLCSNCNVGLGAFGDDIDRLRAAVAYLEKWEGGDDGRERERT